MGRYQELIAERRKKREAVEKWYAERESIIAPIVDKIHDIGGDADVDSEYLYIRLTGDKHKLAAAVRILRTAGFKTDTNPPGANDTTWYGSYYRPSDELWTSAYLIFTSSVCRRVKVGTRVVPERTEDVYETVCGEVDGNLEPVAQEATADDSIPF